MSLTSPNAFSLLLALSGHVPAGTTPGLNRLLAAQDPDPDRTVRGIATFRTVPTAEQVQALEELGLAVQPMQHVALANVAGPVSLMQAAIAYGVITDVYPDERVREKKPVRAARRFQGEPRIESPRDSVVLAMVR